VKTCRSQGGCLVACRYDLARLLLEADEFSQRYRVRPQPVLLMPFRLCSQSSPALASDARGVVGRHRGMSGGSVPGGRQLLDGVGDAADPALRVGHLDPPAVGELVHAVDHRNGAAEQHRTGAQQSGRSELVDPVRRRQQLGKGAVLDQLLGVPVPDAFGARESDLVAPGRERVVIEVGGVRVGLATCFDLRFADQFTALGRDGAELVVVPASWGAGPGKEEQWDLLTRARATDAQPWLLACDRAWAPPTGNDPLGVGRTVLVDPLGEVRARLGQPPGLLRAEVDVDVVRTVRERVSVL
jgi:hypothetical protein